MKPKRQPRQQRRKPSEEKPRPTAPSLFASGPLRLLGLLSVGIVACTVYANSLYGDFVWDDRMLIIKDPEVQTLTNIGGFFTEDFFLRQDNDLGYGYYRPIVKSTYAIDFAVWGSNPSGYHFTNILLHAACAILVVLLLRRLRMPTGAALVAGLIFAVHPIHTENVAWIAGRTDLLAFLFSGLSLIFYLVASGERSPDGVDRRPGAMAGRIFLLLFSLAFFALAMLAKEMSVVLVPWIVSIELFLHRKGIAQSILAAAPFAAVVGAYLMVRLFVVKVAMPGQPEGHNIGTVLVSAGQLTVRYLGWMVGLGERNAYVVNPYVSAITDKRFVVAAAVLAVLTYAAWRWGRRDGLALTLVAMLATSFGPVLNLVRTAGPPDMGNLMAERFCYFPSFPFVALAVLAGSRLAMSGSRRTRVICCAALAAWIVWGVHATVARNRVWRDNLTFLTTTLEQSPDAALLWTNLANHHLENGNPAKAQLALARATELAPTNPAVMTAHATLLVATGRPQDAVPIQERIVALASRSRPVVLCNLAYLYRLTGEQEKSLAILEKLLADGRQYSAMYFNLAEIYRERGETQRARVNYQKALLKNPGDLQMRAALAQFEAENGQLAEAERIYREGLDLFPEDSRIYNNLASLRHRQGDTDGALDLLARALEYRPTTINRINYARLLASTGNGSEAIVQLEAAIQSAPDAESRSAAERELTATRALLSR
jgi:tetratricopeptide (TPR) repeat protein